MWDRVHNKQWTCENVVDVCLYDDMTSGLKLWIMDPDCKGSYVIFTSYEVKCIA